MSSELDLGPCEREQGGKKCGYGVRLSAGNPKTVRRGDETLLTTQLVEIPSCPYGRDNCPRKANGEMPAPRRVN